MAKRMFSVTAHWDDEARVFYSESDIVGLHIEAATIEEFEEVMMDLAPSLVIANHFTKEELAMSRPEDLIPAILWQRPAGKAALTWSTATIPPSSKCCEPMAFTK